MPASKFTEANRAVIVHGLRTGTSLAGVCRQIGVRLKTAEGWLTRGRRETEGPYFDFRKAVEEARLEHARAGMTQAEFDRHLAKSVREGSVQAMRLWWSIHGTKDSDPLEEPMNVDEAPGEEDEFDALEREDELEKRRRRRQKASSS